MVHRLLIAMGVKHGLMFRHKHLRHVVPHQAVIHKLKKLHGRGGVERKEGGRVSYPVDQPPPLKIPKQGGKVRHVLQFRE